MRSASRSPCSMRLAPADTTRNQTRNPRTCEPRRNHLRVLRASPSSSALKFLPRDAANRQLRSHGSGTGVVSLRANWPAQHSTMRQQTIVNIFHSSHQIRTPANDATYYSVSKKRLRSRCIRDRPADPLIDPDDRSGFIESLHQELPTQPLTWPDWPPPSVGRPAWPGRPSPSRPPTAQAMGLQRSCRSPSARRGPGCPTQDCRRR